MSDILDRPLADIAKDLRAGKVSAVALHEAAAANHERRAESLGAYKMWAPERARKEAEAADAVLAVGGDLGPLQGFPVSVKDLYGVKGYPTFAGTPKRLPPKWEVEGPVITRLRRQQAVITGKTHTVELAFGGLGSNPHWGTPRNPWDAKDHRVPGGSSAGAGVSLAVGSAVLALGTDTAGSVRLPAAMTGQVGLKTSYGRWPIDGIVPLSPSLDTAGPLARSVADAAYAFYALDGASPRRAPDGAERGMSGLRLGVADDFFWNDCSPGVAEGVKTALDELARAGATLVELKLPEASRVDVVFRKGGLAAVELYAQLKAELPEWLDLIQDIIAQRLAEGGTLPAHEYLARKRLFAELGAQAAERLAGVDALLTPTLPVTPPTLDAVSELKIYREANLLALRNTGVVNYLGLCALTLPVALDKAGMPVGLQLIARHGEDERLLALGMACERALGTGRERMGRPPLCAA